MDGKTIPQSESLGVLIMGVFMDEIERFELDKVLIDHEGLKLFPYYCSAGFMTIGVGRNLETNPISPQELKVIGERDPKWVLGKSSITVDEVYLLLHNDVDSVINWLQALFTGFDSFEIGRRFALIDLGFCLGRNKFLKFRKMIQAVKDSQWQKAEVEMRDSRWARQVQKSRVEDNSYMLLTGELPERFRYQVRMKNDRNKA